jgi:hypothetical protein
MVPVSVLDLYSIHVDAKDKGRLHMMGTKPFLACLYVLFTRFFPLFCFYVPAIFKPHNREVQRSKDYFLEYRV